MHYNSIKCSIALITILSFFQIHSEQNQTRAFFPDPGFTCCSVVPGLVCSIAESIIAGIIFPSCPCSVACSTIERNQLIQEDSSKNMAQLLDHLPQNSPRK